jgi:hypothetical protein
MKSPSFLRLSGTFLGAWLALVYAFVSVQINVAALPGIPLPEPKGGAFSYYLGYLVGGAVIGLVACWPDNKWFGAFLGALGGALVMFYLPWKNALQSTDAAVGTIFLTLTTFLPLVIFTMPVSFLMRWVAENLPTQAEGSLNIRRIGPPIGVTAATVALAALSLYPTDVRSAFYSTQALVESGLAVTSDSALPHPLQEVDKWFPNATGKYTLEWTDDTRGFNGQVPITSFSNSNYLIIVRFENHFSFACVYAPGVKVPSCTNYE